MEIFVQEKILLVKKFKNFLPHKQQTVRTFFNRNELPTSSITWYQILFHLEGHFVSDCGPVSFDRLIIRRFSLGLGARSFIKFYCIVSIHFVLLKSIKNKIFLYYSKNFPCIFHSPVAFYCFLLFLFFSAYIISILFLYFFC